MSEYLTTRLATRLEFLRRTQNTDAGWGYFPGKQSWIEPTVYAALALHGEPQAARAWESLLRWQNPDGSFRPSGEVQLPTWATALAVILATARKDLGHPLQAAADWLLSVESSDRGQTGSQPRGWPWTHGAPAAAAAEPTGLTLVALKKAATFPEVHMNTTAFQERIKVAETHLANSPETTFALLGLQAGPMAGVLLGDARTKLSETRSRLTHAWLALALRLAGESPAVPSLPPSEDITISALEALGDPGGNFRFFQVLPTKGAA